MLSAVSLICALAFAPQRGVRVPSRAVHISTTRMGLFDGMNKGSFYDDDAPSQELETFQKRTKKQQDDFKKMSPKLREKLLKESAAADPDQPNRGIIYAIGIVLALIIFGGNGVLYELKPAALVSADQMREAAEIPGGQDQQKARIPTFGESMGSAKPKP